MESKKSNFSGFLDGYKANNLASMSSTFRYKKIEMKEHVDSILMILSQNPSPQAEKLKNEFKAFNSNLIYNLDSFDVLLNLGESLGLIITSYKNLEKTIKDLLYNDIKKIVYHYIDLAKKSEDTKTIEMAIEIGERL